MTDEAKGQGDATRCGFVALIGAPNVGKSTLVNALVGSKVTIVSRKVQTTRALIRGIVIEGNAQIILVDTPGIFAPRRRLDRAMVSTAWSGAHDADLVCVLLDAKSGLDEEANAILAKLETVAHPKILVLNKVDLVQREKLLALAQAANERMRFEHTFMISALSGDGVADLRQTLAKLVPAGPFLYPEDQMSDAPMRHLAAEITREKILQPSASGTAVPVDGRDRQLDRPQGQVDPHRADDFCRAREPAQDRARQGRRHHQVDRRAGACRDRRDHGRPRASVPVRQGARELG
ncbi:GTP-binding protein Era [Bradyrhizobium sp. USDA 4502]